MGNLFFDLTIILVVSAALSIVFRIFRQPPILSYILTGILLGAFSLITLENREAITSLAEIGVTLLLFTLGLELKFPELKSVGKTSLLAGILQIAGTGILSFLVAVLLGFSRLESIFISGALTFSSTIIIVKLLSDKRDLRSLYGKISIGILLVQDFVAIIALIFLSGLGSSGGLPNVTELGMLILKAFVLFGWTYVLGKYFLPKVIEKIAKSQELLFLFTLAWAFGISAFVASPLIGFSIEIGGLIAGLALANTAESYQMVSRVRPLRDFFITIFFVTLGLQTVFIIDSAVILPIIIFLLLVVIGKPAIVLSVLGFLGHRKRTSFLSALSFGQISEFSFVLMFTGERLGLVSPALMAVVTAVGVISFISSTYTMIASNRVYKFFAPFIGIFERKNAHERRDSVGNLKDHIVLIGVRKMGEEILDALRRDEENKLVVVDFDPDIIDVLEKDGIPSFFGDISDPEVWELTSIAKAKLVISTVSDPEDNINLLRSIGKLKKKPTVVVLALEKSEAKEFYKEGADYVVLPHIVGGHHLAKILVDKDQMELIEKYKERDLKDIS